MFLIDADELLSLYEGEDENLRVSLRVVKQNIKDMPTIEAEPKWIQITEQAPPEGCHILVTYKFDEDDYETSELDYGMSKAENSWHWRKVIAWMPMPEPYKEETDNEAN